MDTYHATILHVLDQSWLRLEPFLIGKIPASLGTPDSFVVVTKNGRPYLRVHLYDHAPISLYEKVIVWRDAIYIGQSDYVHAINLVDKAVTSFPVDSYFCDFYPTREYLLITSAERLHCIDPDVSTRWVSERIGVDGVLLHESGPPTIRGEAEVDPPGGWVPFELLAADGSLRE